MNIGIDLDNTMAPTLRNMVNFLNKKYNKSKSYKSSKTSSCWNLFHEDYFLYLRDWVEFLNSDAYKKMPPIKNSVKIINNLNKKHKLFLITARNEDQREQTVYWIDKNYKASFEKMLFGKYYEQKNIPIVSKGDFCKQFEIDIMIEDDFKQILDVQAKSPNTKVFAFNKNKSYTWFNYHDLKNVTIVSNWNEVYKKISKLEK